MSVRPRILIVALIAAAFAPAVSAAPANETERYYLGDYRARIVDGDRPTACRVHVLWVNDVGGEVVTQGCGAWPDLAEATRWSFDAENGEARFVDPLHKPRFRMIENDAGFVAILRDDTHLWLEALPKPAPKPKRRVRK